MKVVHIGFKYGQCNTGGAAIAATRLHNALLAHNVESHYICVWQCEDGVNVHELPGRHGVARWFYLVLTKFLRAIWRLSSYKRSIPLNLIPLYGLENELLAIKPDIVHIHWITADVVSYHQLKRIRRLLNRIGISVRIVVNLHDLYLLNVFDPHPGRDLRYIRGVDKNNSTMLERVVFIRKKKLIADLMPIFVGPSKWVCQCCKESVIGKPYKVFDIPNIIPEDFYYEGIQRHLNKRTILLFGSYGGRSNLYKGFADLEAALEILPQGVKDRCELHIFGEDAKDMILHGVPVKFLGMIKDVNMLRQVYNASDVFLFPSVEETQGMTKIEAMLCGLPVVTFARTACAEGIEHQVTGWIANDGDVGAFAKGIAYYVDHRANPEFIAGKAKMLYGKERTIEKFLTMYAQMEGVSSIA